MFCIGLENALVVIRPMCYSATTINTLTARDVYRCPSLWSPYV